MNIKKQTSKKKRSTCFVLLFLCSLSVNATSLPYKGGSGKIVNTATNALDTLNTMKKKHGNGDGTLILVHNKTLEELVITDFGSSYGQFYTRPINIPPKKTLAFFHVKIKNSVTYESVGKVIVQEERSKTKHAIWWDTPSSGKNTCSINGIIAQDGTSPLLHFVIN